MTCDAPSPPDAAHHCTRDHDHDGAHMSHGDEVAAWNEDEWVLRPTRWVA